MSVVVNENSSISPENNNSKTATSEPLRKIMQRLLFQLVGQNEVDRC